MKLIFILCLDLSVAAIRCARHDIAAQLDLKCISGLSRNLKQIMNESCIRLWWIDLNARFVTQPMTPLPNAVPNHFSGFGRTHFFSVSRDVSNREHGKCVWKVSWTPNSKQSFGLQNVCFAFEQRFNVILVCFLVVSARLPSRCCCLSNPGDSRREEKCEIPCFLAATLGHVLRCVMKCVYTWSGLGRYFHSDLSVRTCD